MTTITAVTLDGSAVSLANVVYSIRMSHGRANITDGPSAATCEITLIGAGLPTVEISQVLAVTAYGQLRFTGKVSDLNPLEDATTGKAAIRITATGLLTDLALDPVTATTWPEESSALRASRILDAVGITDYTATGDFTVLSKDGEISNALNMLSTLASDTGAAVFDTPDGTIIFQDLLARAQSFIPNTWATMTGTWTAQTGTWADQTSPSVAEPVVIPASAIVWQPKLTKQRGNIVNRVTIEYGTGSPRPTVMEESTTSQTQHKTRAAALSTDLANITDATTRAQNIITRQSEPRYILGNVSVLVHTLDTTKRSEVIALMCGSRAIISGLPDAYPVTDWLGVVEGWSETFTVDRSGNESHILGLALSDPRASFAALQWSGVTPGKTWATIPTGRIWSDITSNELLAA